MAPTKSAVQALLDGYAEAIREKDIDRLMSHYSQDSVYFDLVAPLRFVGASEIRKNFLRWFDTWQSAIGVEMRDVKILMSNELATAFWLHRASGTLKEGKEVDYWVRATVCCQRSDQGWLIKHEHISIPADLKSGRVVMGPAP